MELTGIPTPKIDWNASNLVEQWKQFQEHVSLIFSGPLTGKEESEKMYLSTLVGRPQRKRRIQVMGLVGRRCQETKYPVRKIQRLRRT